MIEIIGEEGTAEYDAAIALSNSFDVMWPGIKNSPVSQEHIKIAANVKISGYRISDVDVVVSGIFNRERRFIPKKIINDKTGKPIVKRDPITVQNFVIVIEVKDHPEGSIQVIGDKVSVKYSRGGSAGWKSATDQNVEQVHAIHAYLKDLGQDVYVHRCLYMRGITSSDVGSVIAAGFSGPDLLTSIAQTSRVSFTSKGYILSSAYNASILQILNAPIFKTITPSALDRRRMDLIISSSPESKELFENLGTKMISLRGHGGSGKTVMCLQAAWETYNKKNSRTLVLTYNQALAADIKRLLALLRIPSNVEEGGILVDTVMSFMFSWFYALKLIDSADQFLESYESLCLSAIELIQGGAVTEADIKAIVKLSPDRYDFDAIFIDEAQDWPQSEADLIKLLYPIKSICIADGIDQLLRGKRTDWNKNVSNENRGVISLNRCLRMKRNLAVFANKVAEAGRINWAVSPNDMAGGGKVIILIGDYSNNPSLHPSLVEAAKSKGNSEIDFLFCMPSTQLIKDDSNTQSHLGNFLLNQGYEIWNGVDEKQRKDFPRSKGQFRLVHYNSCRGLEGWTVILEHADSYWNECFRNRKNDALLNQEPFLFEDVEELASSFAWQRIMIALTRPIDTLVVSLKEQDSIFSKAILDIAYKNSEFIEIQKA
jgi:hypothetical protein